MSGLNTWDDLAKITPQMTDEVIELGVDETRILF
jgi:hypothetical protein